MLHEIFILSISKIYETCYMKFLFIGKIIKRIYMH